MSKNQVVSHVFDAAGGSSRVMLGGAFLVWQRDLELGEIVAFLVAVQGQQALLRKVCLANSRGGLAEKVENVGTKRSKHQIWCKKNQPHLDLATCEAWVNSTNIEACRRMMVSWRRCQMVFEASKQYGSREAGGIATHGQLLFTIFVLDPIDSVDLILQHSPGANHAKGER